MGGHTTACSSVLWEYRWLDSHSVECVRAETRWDGGTEANRPLTELEHSETLKVQRSQSRTHAVQQRAVQQDKIYMHVTCDFARVEDVTTKLIPLAVLRLLC